MSADANNPRTAEILRDLARARAEAQRQALLAVLKQPEPKEGAENG